MELCSPEDFEMLVRDACVLEADGYGPKVLLRKDNRIIKLFRIKRLLSLSLLYPYSVRFKRNAEALKRAGITAPTVEKLFFCWANRRHGIVYPALEGTTLEQILEEGRMDEALMRSLSGFIARLHEKRIYFRSLHLGNILMLPEGGFGLIDVADMRFYRRPLSASLRKRNFAHLLRRSNHEQLLNEYGLDRFMDHYLEAAGLPPEDRRFYL